jgi:hypothetical protein
MYRELGISADAAPYQANLVCQTDEVDPLPIEPSHDGSGTPN